MLMQVDLSRIFLIFLINTFLAIFFLYLGISTIIRNRARLNVTFSCFFNSIAIGLIVNAVYVVINEIVRSEPLALFLNYISGFLIFLGPIFMLATNLILLYSGVSYSLKSELKIIFSYAFVLGFMAVFYFFGGIQFNESTNWTPEWTLPYFIYVVVIVSGFAVIPTIYTSFRILKTMEDPQLRNRWIRLMVSLFGLFTYLYIAFISNYLNTVFLSTILSLYGLTVPLWVWLIYIGVKTETEK